MAVFHYNATAGISCQRQEIMSATDMNNAIEISDICFTWPGSSRPALDIKQFFLAENERLFLLGSSGSGKTTLLNIIAGLMLPSCGTVNVLGQNMAKLGGRSRDRFRAKNIGLIFQQFNLIPYLDVRTNIELSARLAGHYNKQTLEQITQLLTTLRIDHSLLDQRADRLSVGQQQRVAVARAMINEPALIIADEPTSSLDHGVRDEFIELLLTTQQRSGCAILFVSHDLSLQTHFDRVVDMAELNRVLAPGAEHVV
jgi:putative ABC transport system ATP-binding protein